VPIRFADVVEISEAIGATRSRRAKTDAIAGLLGRSGKDLPIVVGLLVGAPRQGRVGVGYAALFSLEVEPASVPALSVRDVDAAIDRLAAATGAGSVERRRAELTGLLMMATAAEQDYFRRVLTGEVRHGALEGVMLDAVARASGIDPALVRRAVMLSGDLGRVAELAVGEGRAALASIELEVGRPVVPMLAATSPDVESALAEMGVSSVEWKLDGARIQAHRSTDAVSVYTRNLNDVTARLPRVVEVVAGLPIESIILDGEALALRKDGRPRSFEETMSSFSADVGVGDIEVIPFFFDVLAVDGIQLIDLPLGDRQAVLDRVVPEDYRVPRVVTGDAAEAAAFLADARARNHEGVMVKDPASRYEAGRRGSAWRKIKPAHTLDLVILAAEWGHGRREGTLSNLHLGARDPEAGSFVMLGKTFKGLTDKMLAWQTERLLELEERRTRSTVFVRPELVVEIAFDGVLPSPRYPGGMSLRFARVKAHRPDKPAAEADTIGTVRAIFERR
jgi:DNA ligase-1